MAIFFAVPLYFGGIFLLWTGITGLTPPGLEVVGVWRILFGVFGGFLLAAGGWFGKEIAEAIFGKRPIRRSSERGELLIAPRAIRELIAGLLQRELGIKRPKVEISDESESLKIYIGLHLPLQENLPGITERIRNLVTTEIERRIGITVSSVDIAVHGISHRGPAGEREGGSGENPGEDLPPS
ncbi:hypothetical protein ACVNPS_05780 [Candidatus Bipolaricaulota sp. J31]